MLVKMYFFNIPKGRDGTKGIVVKCSNSRSFIVKASDGATYRRNRIHIRVDHSCAEDLPNCPEFVLPIFPSFDANDNSSDAARNPANSEPPARNRPLRNCRPPAWLSDYV